jgi:hypothetical protein
MYAAPRIVTDASECRWYHTMDLPGLGTTEGSWDLRATIDDYLGRYDFRGKRCLDVGAASGHLTFEMERCGARDLVSVDIRPEDQNDFVPFHDSRYDLAARKQEEVINLRRTQNSYWLAHRLLESKAQVYYGSAYELPTALGHFDVAMIGMMLPHARDPLLVLERVAALADTIIVTQPAPQVPDAFAYFMPDPDTLNPYWAWWSMSEACLARMLGIVGFTVVNTIQAEHACPGRRDRDLPGAYKGRSEMCTTVVASKRIV